MKNYELKLEKNVKIKKQLFGFFEQGKFQCKEQSQKLFNRNTSTEKGLSLENLMKEIRMIVTEKRSLYLVVDKLMAHSGTFGKLKIFYRRETTQ